MDLWVLVLCRVGRRSGRFGLCLISEMNEDFKISKIKTKQLTDALKDLNRNDSTICDFKIWSTRRYLDRHGIFYDRNLAYLKGVCECELKQKSRDKQALN